jgi:hypothetical protein
MSLRLILFIIDWLRSLSISIHSSILSNYQSYLFCPFPYIMSIFYPLYTFLFILSILSILPMSNFVVDYYLFVVHYLSILIPLMSICGILYPKAPFEDNFCKVDYTIKSVQLLLSFLFHMFHITKHSG